MRPATWAWLAALVGWTALLAFYHLDGGARFEMIDCWVAQTAREMIDANDWLIPRFSGEVRMQKSPGAYWAVMATSLLRSQPVDEVAVRVPNGLAAIALVVTVFWLTRRIAGDRAAIFAGFATASSTLVLWWSHRGASDFGLTTFTTLSLACLWIATEDEPPGKKRVGLLLLGYFAAGLGMIYKMPMPLAVIGVPAVIYVVVMRRWRILASAWHLVGLGVFLLPWLPWVIAVCFVQENALLKWKIESIDRFTGVAPNVEDADSWKALLTYLLPTLVYTIPFTLSLPGAVARVFRPAPGLRRDGMAFMFIWFASLLVFFTASAGKEARYFLPALPPLFVLLGVELAHLFDPQRPRRERWVRAGAITVWVGLPVTLSAGVYALSQWWVLSGSLELSGEVEWLDVLLAYLLTAAILGVGFATAAWLYLRRRPHASFALIVATMWVMWLWAWPRLMPMMVSQRPHIDFAEQLRSRFLPGDEADLYGVGSHDPRIVWYSDYRIPRVIEQFDLLAEQRERFKAGLQDTLRDFEYEKRRYGQEMIRLLEQPRQVLFIAAWQEYVEFLVVAPPALAERGREMPPVHLWAQSRYGTYLQHFVLFGNKPPRFIEEPLRVPEKVRAKIEAAQAQAAEMLGRAASQPTTTAPGEP
jgi:hypothetical protein